MWLFRTFAYVIPSHNTNLSKMHKHWGSFLTHCMPTTAVAAMTHGAAPTVSHHCDCHCSLDSEPTKRGDLQVWEWDQSLNVVIHWADTPDPVRYVHEHACTHTHHMTHCTVALTSTFPSFPFPPWLSIGSWLFVWAYSKFNNGHARVATFVIFWFVPYMMFHLPKL